MILFDTDICVELLRGNRDILRRRLDEPDDVAVSFMTAAELFYGSWKSKQPEANRHLVEAFLLSVTVIHSNLRILNTFGELKSWLEGRGSVLADADLFIAATALSAGSRLITGNIRHYNRIEELKLENWLR
ncbi:MAG: PIN domain-containing protein [Spirochaetales bacterium]|nr:PIN domain-containing protein [Spirochaetales bacterium]